MSRVGRSLATFLRRSQPTYDTIVTIRCKGGVIMAGDGNYMGGGDVVKKTSMVRVHRIGNILVGYAGAPQDAFMVIDRLVSMLKDARADVIRAAARLVKEWRTSNFWSRVNARIMIGSKDHILEFAGDGALIRHDGGIACMGSGGGFALAAGTALLSTEEMGTLEAAAPLAGVNIHVVPRIAKDLATGKMIAQRALDIAVALDSSGGGKQVIEVVDGSALRGDGSDFPAGFENWASAGTDIHTIEGGEDEDDDDDDDDEGRRSVYAPLQGVRYVPQGIP